MADGVIRRVLARVEVSFSNSMIEAFWRSLRHQWLYLHSLETFTQLEQLIDFYVREHNTKMPHHAFGGQTPDEMYFDHADRVHDRLHPRSASGSPSEDGGKSRRILSGLRTIRSSVCECYQRRRKCAAVTPECSRTQQGWTFIGWAVCLVWAIAAKTPEQKRREATEQATIQAQVMADSYRREIEKANEDYRLRLHLKRADVAQTKLRPTDRRRSEGHRYCTTEGQRATFRWTVRHSLSLRASSPTSHRRPLLALCAGRRARTTPGPVQSRVFLPSLLDCCTRRCGADG